MMNCARKNQEGWIVPSLAAVLTLLLLAGPLVLHYGQITHNELPTAAERFPADSAPAPGEVYASTVTAILRHELDSRTGWRPNDIFLWGPTLWADNNSNRQLGIIQALRESVRIFKDHLTKISSDEFDPNLVEADTALRNDARKFWLPSAESKLEDAIKRFDRYIKGLQTEPRKSRPINERNVELIRLFQAWTDLLGGAYAKLYSEEIPFLEIDDVFYEAQGFAHVMHQLSIAVHMEYRKSIADRPVVGKLFDDVAVALEQAATMKPLIVLNGSPSGVFANHRRNLAAFISEARQNMYSLREELEK
jgi:hypothetical protein